VTIIGNMYIIHIDFKNKCLDTAQLLFVKTDLFTAKFSDKKQQILFTVRPSHLSLLLSLPVPVMSFHPFGQNELKFQSP
jgi:hypothetical protein